MLINRCFVSSPIGMLCLEEEGEAITSLYIVQDTNEVDVLDDSADEIDTYKECKTELLDKASQELNEYFEGKRKDFDLPLRMRGTEFQMKVWKALCQIPYGETRCYEDIAKSIENPKACRAIGGANNKNHIMIMIPCHRVIGKNGSLVGFGGGIEAKRFLLELEKNSDNEKM